MLAGKRQWIATMDFSLRGNGGLGAGRDSHTPSKTIGNNGGQAKTRGPRWISRDLMVVLSVAGKSVPSLGTGFRRRCGTREWLRSHGKPYYKHSQYTIDTKN